MEIGDLRKQRRQLRQVVEPGKPRRQPVSGGVDVDLEVGRQFAERRRPAVEPVDVQEAQLAPLEIRLHDEEIRHRIGDRRAGCKNDAAAVVLLLHELHALHHLLALFGPFFVDAQDVFGFRIDRDVFIVVRFVKEECFDVQVVKINRRSALLNLRL